MEDVHYAIDAAKFLERATHLDHIESIRRIFIYDKILDWFGYGLMTDSINWLCEYIVRSCLCIDETMSFSELVNDDLFILIEKEDLTILRQMSKSSIVIDFCDKLKHTLQLYNLYG